MFAFQPPGAQGEMHYYASENPAGPRQSAGPSDAFIAMHGHSRDANKTFNAALLTMQRADALSHTLVVAPLYQVAGARAAKCSTRGVPAAAGDDLLWTCASWLEGGTATNGSHPTSFAVMDALIAELKQRWPSLQRITFAGFSAGGQMVQHYIAFAAAWPAGVSVRFVVADPGTWLYFDAVRPVPHKQGEEAPWSACVTEGAMAPGCNISFTNPVAEACPAFNRWKYGTDALPAGLGIGAEAARLKYAASDVSYLEGSLDSDNARGTAYKVLDTSCAAEAQGPYRMQRGIGYAAYDDAKLSSVRKHTLTIVPGCAHDVACVFPSDAARAVLLGTPP